MSKEALDEKESKVENLWFESRKNITNNALNAAFKLGPLIPPGKIIKNTPRTRNQVTSVSGDETPYFILLVGSPGVGKTTTIKKYIRNELDLSYNKFYHISLDFVVERIKPYRASTKKAYNELKEKRNNGKLSNENFKTLAKSYSIVQTTSENFGLKKENNNGSKKKPKGKSGYGRLYTVVKTGIEKAIENRYHVIYDTTFSDCKEPKKDESKEDLEERKRNSYKKLTEIVSLLEENRKEHPQYKKYKIIVMLVTSDKDTIEMQLRKRHENMMTEQGFIRAINISLVKKFMECNQFGFDSAEEFYTDYHKRKNNNEKNNEDRYTYKDFDFIKRYNKFDPNHKD